MIYRKKSDLVRSQQSIFYFSGMIDDDQLRNRPQYDRKLYTSMLIEDVSISLIPINTRAKGFRVFLTPSDSKIEELIAAAITRSSYERDLAEAVYDFFKQCSRTIMAFGEAIYEIVYLSKPDNQKVIGFELIPIQPLTVERRLDRFVQYIPKEVTQGKLSQYVQLSPERILIFNLPTYVQKNFNHMMESLAFLSDNILPEFALLKGGAISKIPFDSEVHLRTQKLALADAGKLIGWNARGLLQREMLEYYFVHRQLLFERFKIKLLDKILATLNEGLARAGKEIEFSGRLEVEGLPTILDADAAQAHLAKGDKSFKEILKPFLKF